MIGSQLGHYHIEERLGVGGMAEVYKARDTRLGREVAIKVLPESFANNPDRLQRFEREARLLASLNHPNIAAIYGLEESGRVRFLALELVLGKTLREYLAAGEVTVEETLGICFQIAEALEFAHEKGILHRDLKPENIKVTPEGKVKVLDFGLAKAFQVEGPTADLSRNPTTSIEPTHEGRIFGTVTYMSPEQARGKPLDKRSDVWSFGCVLYEMLTRRKAFGEETLSDTIAAILGRDPDWLALPLSTPSSINVLLQRCLRKDAHRRLRDMGDVRIEIEDSLRDAPRVTRPVPLAAPTPKPAPPPPSRPARSVILPTALVGLALVGVAGWGIRQWLRTQQSQNANKAGRTGSPAATEHPVAASIPHGHTDEVSAVAMSPNGDWLASGSADKTVVLWDVSSGLPKRTLSGHQGRVNGVAFSRNGRLLASGGNDKVVKLWDVAEGAEVATLTGHAAGISAVAFSPDGRWLASASEDKTVRLWDPASHSPVRIFTGSDDSLRAVAFSLDGNSLAASGDDRTIRIWEVGTGKERTSLPRQKRGVSALAFSPDGSWLVSGSWNEIKFWAVSDWSEARSLTGHHGWVLALAFKLDGSSLASGSGDNTVQIWNTATGEKLRSLTRHIRGVSALSFSPNGQLLASGSWDKTIKLWETVSWSEKRTLVGADQ